MESIVNIGIFTIITLAFGSIIAGYVNVKNVYLIIKSGKEGLKVSLSNIFHILTSITFFTISYVIIYTLIGILVNQAVNLTK
jgi:hypothetical protein